MSDQTNEIQAISSAITEIGKNLESNYLTKSEYKHEATKLADAVGALNKAMDKQRVVTKSHPLFGDYSVARDFVDCLRGAMSKSDVPQFRNLTDDPKSQWHVERAGGTTGTLDTYTPGAASELVPTSVSSVFSMLMIQGGIARRECTVIEGVEGNLVLTKRTGTSTAAFTASGGVLQEDACISATNLAVGAITLSPQQIGALSVVSEKLLYSSAVNLAEIVAADLVEQTQVLEDNSVLRGDATAAYGGIVGIYNTPGVPKTSTAAASFNNFDPVLALPGLVHESVYASPNAKYYVSGAFLGSLKATKASGSGQYFLDPTSGRYMISGYPVVVFQRMDNVAAAGKYPVMFGDLKKACTVVLGRNLEIRVSGHWRFNCFSTAWRLSEDFSAGVIQPTAIALASVTA